ncbi:hypothetical protein Pflav_083630 [Phytohabitans flavus]|uniref:Uncharacterized protein n=1 Tax=Phytohabitans flavus TaxID=1076124 RepID=A0A6F8Y7F3_9ACTN|nr:hypothetical protein Pflav_083630 [Phytohabitans flavus]
MAAEVHRRAHRVEGELGHPYDIVGALDLLDQHDELVAAHPGDKVTAGRQPHGEAAGHGTDQVVARVVPKRVVDRLEAVEVEVADADPGIGLRLDQGCVGCARFAR